MLPFLARWRVLTDDALRLLLLYTLSLYVFSCFILHRVKCQVVAHVGRFGLERSGKSLPHFSRSVIFGFDRRYPWLSS